MRVADPEQIGRVVRVAREASSIPDGPPACLIDGVEPEAVWLLVALAGHGRRQRWVADVVRERLNGDLSEIGRMGAFGHPADRPQSGTVPGFPEWEYYFHGIGCCLTNKVDGTTVDVDFDRDGGCEAIDPFFYSNQLRDTRAPSLAEERIRHAAPCDEAWMTDVPVLEEAGCLDASGLVRLAELGREYASRLESVVEAIDQHRREGRRVSAAALALAMGDARFALQLMREAGDAGSAAVPDWVERQAARQERQRVDTLVRRFEADEGAAPEDSKRLSKACYALQSLATMGEQYAVGKISMLLATREPDRLLSKAVAITEAWGDPGGLEDFLLGMLERCGGVEPPNPFIRLTACRTLLRNPRRRTSAYFRRFIVPALDADARAGDGEAGLLLYAVDGAKGLDKLARALAHAAPMARSDAAAALALIGTPAAVGVLLDSLAGRGAEETREVRAALMECAAPAAWEVVRRYESEYSEVQPRPETVWVNGRLHEVTSMEEQRRQWAGEGVRWRLAEWRDCYTWITVPPSNE